MMEPLTSQELRIIQEEESTLTELKLAAPSQSFIHNREVLLQQIFELREELSQANSDDIGPLTEQISRLTLLINQGDQSASTGANLSNPYFARLKIKDGKATRDLYIGTQVYRSPNGKIQIVDWKSSPVAAIYFRYEEGEEFEEEFGDRVLEGEVILKRVLKICAGELVRIQTKDFVLERRLSGEWRRGDTQLFSLRGGSGVATRPEHSRSGNPKLGVFSARGEGGAKFLPEITSLIDEEQFKLITQPETGVIAIQGTAGSGKTTVALHRVAWLHFQDKKRFIPENMMVMVFNRALANYISKVLPALGVDGVQIDFFENWASRIRGRLFSGLLPKSYNENTPVSVIRFKKHPVLLEVINGFIEEKEVLFANLWKSSVRQKLKQDFAAKKLLALPLLERLQVLQSWLAGKVKRKGIALPPLNAELASSIQRVLREFIEDESSIQESLIAFWEELFSNFSRLKTRLSALSDGEFPLSTLEEIDRWLKQQYTQLQDSRKGDEASLDYEDDAIILYMYQLLVGELPQAGGKPIRYAHLMIDEAQDLSPIELKVLHNVAENPKSITLAGDVNQQMIQNNSFKDWISLFQYMGLKGQQLSTLKISYRSTYEIMAFALDILGEQASTKEVHAVRNGPDVELFQFVHQGELAAFLAESLKNLVWEEANASIALICMTPESARTYYSILENMEIPKLRLVADQDFTFTAGVDITDVKQVKGLEFDYVILLDVDTVDYPKNSYSRYLLHIGATRAAHQLWILNYRVPSEILPKSLLENKHGF